MTIALSLAGVIARRPGVYGRRGNLQTIRLYNNYLLYILNFVRLPRRFKIALALGTLEEFSNLFKPAPPEQHLSLDELLRDKTRKRGRQ